MAFTSLNDTNWWPMTCPGRSSGIIALPVHIYFRRRATKIRSASQPCEKPGIATLFLHDRCRQIETRGKSVADYATFRNVAIFASRSRLDHPAVFDHQAIEGRHDIGGQIANQCAVVEVVVHVGEDDQLRADTAARFDRLID